MFPATDKMSQASLNEIATVWSQIFRAHVDDTQESLRGQAAVLERYMGAVLGYLNDVVGDRYLAEDLAQDFAYRFLKGDFRAADPARGKFRSFLKTILFSSMVSMPIKLMLFLMVATLFINQLITKKLKK